jgi:hypothetical protein
VRFSSTLSRPFTFVTRSHASNVCVVATPDAVTLRWNWPFSHTVLAVVETPAPWQLP